MKDYADLVDRAASGAGLDALARQSSLTTGAVIGVLKYLLYWVLPGKKDLNRLSLATDAARKVKNALLKQHGVHSSLDLLQKRASPDGRQALADQSGLPLEFVTEMVHRADYARMPWWRGKTIDHFISAGYPNLKRLAQAGVEQIQADMQRYGQSIGKNLKFGVEADSGGIVARVLPEVVED